MITIENERDLANYPYMEVPDTWVGYICNFIDEVNSLLSIYNLPTDTVNYLETKEKFNGLRIYFCIDKLLEDDLTEDEYLLYHTLEGIVTLLVDKCETKIKYAVKKGIL